MGYIVRYYIRDSNVPHVFEFNKEWQADEFTRKLVKEADATHESHTIKNDMQDNHEEPTGIIIDRMDIAIHIGHKYFNTMLIKTLLSSKEVTRKLSVISMEVAAEIESRQIPKETPMDTETMDLLIKHIILKNHGIRL